MKITSTLLFTALFAVVAWVYLEYSPQPKKETPSDSEGIVVNQKLLDLKSQDTLSWIQIQNIERKETITIYRDEDRWMLKYPVLYKADDWAVEELIKMLTLSFKVTELEPDEDWESYGLLRPKIKIGMEADEWSGRRYLLIGNSSPVGDYVFARWEGKDKYFLIEESIKNTFSKSVYSLRDKHIFRKSRDEYSKMKFQIGKDAFEMVKRQDEWVWVKPDNIQGFSVSEKAIDDLKNRLGSLSVKDFLEREKKKWSDYQLDPPDTVVQVWTPGEDPEELRLGEEVRMRDAYYGRRADEEGLFLIDRGLVVALLDTVVSMAGNLTQVSTGDLDLFSVQ